MKRFLVLIPKDDGGVESYPMKEWLRQHPDRAPVGLDPTHSTSHQLRDGMRKLGWSVQDTDSQVRLIPPETGDLAGVIDSVLGGEAEEPESERLETSFALEYQLRDFISQNLEALSVGGKRLRLYVDERGRDGIEYPTAVGPIDILATDGAGAFYVFELKRARSPDHAIGQLTRYMGWVKQTVGKDRDVHGVIVAKTIGENLRYAVAVIPNLSLFEYEVNFVLKPSLGLADSGRGG